MTIYMPKTHNGPVTVDNVRALEFDAEAGLLRLHIWCGWVNYQTDAWESL